MEKQWYTVKFSAEMTEDDVRAMNKYFYEVMAESMKIESCANLEIELEGNPDRPKLWVCEHCLAAIESREGYQPVYKHYVDEDNDGESKCDWCEEYGFDVLYELL